MTAPLIRCHYCPETFPEAESVAAMLHVEECGRRFRGEPARRVESRRRWDRAA